MKPRRGPEGERADGGGAQSMWPEVGGETSGEERGIGWGLWEKMGEGRATRQNLCVKYHNKI